MSFLQPMLLAALPLVALPIIIHLINRMRFKRIRWAAMEFLLKSQKRNRRKLIIEQLILLALRCLLVLLVGLLLGRLRLGGDTGQNAFHFVVLDDTPLGRQAFRASRPIRTGSFKPPRTCSFCSRETSTAIARSSSMGARIRPIPILRGTATRSGRSTATRW